MSYANAKLILVLVVIGWVIFITRDLKSRWDKQVRQKVTENVMSDHIRFYDGLPMPFFKVRKDDGSIDSLMLEITNQQIKARDEYHRNMYSDYKLVTSYNHHKITDYGSAKEIDSLKCIRFNEMLNKTNMYDSLDLFEDIESAKQIFDAENELDRLNKSCN